MSLIDNYRLDDQDHDWTLRAACRQADPDLFFPERGQSTTPAKAICRICPVRAACLDYANRHGIVYGLWGGQSEDERQKQRRTRTVAQGRSAA